MTFYNVTIDIKQTSGTVCYRIEASSEKEAIEAVKDGGGEPVSEEIEVTSLNWDSASASPV